MASEKDIEKSSEVVEKNKISESIKKLQEQDVASRKDVSLSDSPPLISLSGDAPGGNQDHTNQELVSGGFYCPQISTYGYFHAGCDGVCSNLDTQGYFASQEGLKIPYSGVQMENNSLVYYMPNHNSHHLGNTMATDGHFAEQQPYVPTGYHQNDVSYGSEISPMHYCDMKSLVGNPPNGDSFLRKQKADASQSSTSTTVKDKSSNSLGRDGFVDVKLNKVSAQPLYRKSHNPTAVSNLPGQPLKPLNKVYHPAGKVLSLNNQGQDQLFQGKGIGSFRLSRQTLVDNDRDKMAGKFNRSRGFDVSSELTRGPRANRKEGSSSLISTKKSLDSLTRRDKYNLQDFLIKYEEAKFFMIKSYSEDDIHKSIKYSVWSSTPNGNKKLNAAFREAEARAKETTKCPIFLFFSVNSSGQFVGLAEMIGPVDFNKSMDFWQQDKWHGFFPVKWHIIKDIPNGLFRNIILENNDNRAVTYSRDTQEIGLPQGLKMLQIFKTFQMETSILDDFGFYEEKEKTLRARRRTTLAHPGGATNCNNSSPKHPETTRTMELARRSDRTPTNQKGSLVALTKNLSLNAHQ